LCYNFCSIGYWLRRILALEQITLLSLIRFTEDQLDRLRAVSPRLDVQQVTGASFDDLSEDLRNQVEILYGWGRAIDEAHRYPNLKWIQAHSAGINNILGKPIWQSEVVITTLSGIHPVPMAEHALAMLLAFRWKLLDMFRWQTRAEWPEGRWDKVIMPELRRSTLGIIGYGSIGRELARLAQALGMRVLAANRSGQRRRDEGYQEPGIGDPEATIPEKIYPVADLLEMLPQCDYVVVLAPLTPDTHHLFGTEAFFRMKERAFFFNLGRGPVVDEAALVEALRRGQIAGAGLDVYEQEPLPADSPLWQMENVIISPHVAGFTPKYDERASDLFAENLRRYLAGEPLLNLVNRERGY
jgi:phosphoglycerate dehydrogenase-like enzyme